MRRSSARAARRTSRAGDRPSADDRTQVSTISADGPVVRADLSIDVLTAGRISDRLVRHWRALAVAAENPFVLPDWHDACVATHPADAPFFVVCRKAGAVAGVVPLVRRGRRLLARASSTPTVLGRRARRRTRRAWPARSSMRSPRPPSAGTCGSSTPRTGGAWIEGIREAAAGSAVKVFPDRGHDVLVCVDLERDGPT